MSRLLVLGMDAAGRWSRALSLFAALAAFAAVIGIDCLAGGQFSVGFLYLLACIFAVWCLGDKAGFGVALLGAFGAAALRHVQAPHLLGHAPGVASELWNLCSCILSFALLAIVVHGLGCLLAVERWRASHDELTGALNKSGFERAMVESIRVAQMRGANLVLAYMDLDGFKAVNDQHGHSTGDHVLRTFATAASASVRPSDLFARIGGDEFAALLMLPSDVDGRHVAELLHKRLTAILAGTGFAVTCSLGAVVVAGEEAAADHAILEQADALMYEVKRAGKNELRVARGTALGKALRTAFPPLEGDELDALLRQVDLAERRQRWTGKRAA